MLSTPRYPSASAVSTLLLLAIFTMDVFAQAPIPKGCYSSSQPLTNQGSYKYQSSGNCQGICEKLKQPVLGLSNGNLCWCGDMLPAASSKTSNLNCDAGCDGYGTEMCGGSGYWTIYLTGIDTNVPSYKGGSGGGGGDDSSSAPAGSSTSTPTTPATQKKKHKPTVVTSVAKGTTIFVTRGPESSGAASSSATPTAKSGGSSTNTGAIAAGVVVGIVAIAGIVAGVYFFLRHKRKSQAEEEYKRTQLRDFIGSVTGKPPQTGYSGTSDSRLDPEAGARRTSHGSIADDQDFSRRILRVANPDRT